MDLGCSGKENSQSACLDTDRTQETAFKLWEALPLTPEQRMKATFSTDACFAYDEPLLGRKRLSYKGQTNHVERLNGTFRQQRARLMRKTRLFSRSVEMLEDALTLAFHGYKLSRS